jgi:predicted Fe-S protein YdhL (DUF1289 family)
MDILGNKTLVDTPCIGRCSTTNLGDAICVGCKRTADEVIRWNMFTDAEKTDINLRLKANQVIKG